MSALSYDQVYALARAARFDHDRAITMTAICAAESGLDPGSFNGNAHTGDKSYGLAQINMIANLGPQRRKEFGIASNEELFDPLTNIKAAKHVHDDSRAFTPWSTFNHGSHHQFQAHATAAAAHVGEDWASHLPGPGPHPRVTVSLVHLIAAARTDPTSTDGTPSHPDDVRPVEAALIAEGLLDHARGNDGLFGSATVKAYRAWQHHLGYTGADADGIPGQASLQALGDKHTFTVT